MSQFLYTNLEMATHTSELQISGCLSYANPGKGGDTGTSVPCSGSCCQSHSSIPVKPQRTKKHYCWHFGFIHH